VLTSLEHHSKRLHNRIKKIEAHLSLVRKDDPAKKDDSTEKPIDFNSFERIKKTLPIFSLFEFLQGRSEVDIEVI